MRTIQTAIYKFSELDDIAKQRAKDHHAIGFGYAWEKEALTSLEALAKHFDGKLTDYEVDFFRHYHSYARFAMPELSADEIEKRLNELGDFNPETLKGVGDCKLTGYSSDEDALDGFRIAFYKKGVSDLTDLMREAFDSWLKAAQEDCAYQYSDEAFSEMSDANDYEYYANGDFVGKE
jgi:hypothetical protein